MPKITISVPQDLHDEMSARQDINWDEAACDEFRKRLASAPKAPEIKE